MTSKIGQLSNWGVVVTGTAGFVGSHTCKALISAGAQVAGIDRNPAPKAPGFFPIQAEVPDGLLAAVGAIRNCEQKAFMHFSGLNHVATCEQNPEIAHKENVENTETCFRFASTHGFDKFFFSSTGLVLGTGENFAKEESASLNPESVYAKTKAEAEKQLAKLCSQQKTQCVIVRFANLFGPGAHSDTLIEKLMREASQGRLQTSGLNHQRDFLYVDDAVLGILSLLETIQAELYEIYHLSSGVPTSIDSVVEIISTLIGLPLPQPRLSAIEGSSFLALRSNKLRARTGWQPKYSLREGLRQLAVKKGLIK